MLSKFRGGSSEGKDADTFLGSIHYLVNHPEQPEGGGSSRTTSLSMRGILNPHLDGESRMRAIDVLTRTMETTRLKMAELSVTSTNGRDLDTAVEAAAELVTESLQELLPAGVPRSAVTFLVHTSDRHYPPTGDDAVFKAFSDRLEGWKGRSLHFTRNELKRLDLITGTVVLDEPPPGTNCIPQYKNVVDGGWSLFGTSPMQLTKHAALRVAMELDAERSQIHSDPSAGSDGNTRYETVTGILKRTPPFNHFVIITRPTQAQPGQTPSAPRHAGPTVPPNSTLATSLSSPWHGLGGSGGQ